jgi:hypothetical protein
MTQWNTERLVALDKQFIWHPFTNMRLEVFETENVLEKLQPKIEQLCAELDQCGRCPP